MTSRPIDRHPNQLPHRQTTWQDYVWPHWIPDSVRVGVEHYCPNGPWRWLAHARLKGAPDLGTLITVPALDYKPGHRTVTGRYVHCGMNLYGRLVHLDDAGVSLTYLHDGNPIVIPFPPRSGRTA